MRNFFVFLFLCFANAVNAQEVSLWQLTDEDGLPSMTVYDLHQDSRGYIWIGTEMGLSRFDGLRFTQFEIPQSTSKAITDIKEDSQGRLYFVNFSGQLFRMTGNEVEEISPPFNEPIKLYSRYVIDNQDRIWLGTSDLWMAEADGHWQSIYSFGENLIRDILIDDNQNIWAIDDRDQLLLKKSDGSLIKSQIPIQSKLAYNQGSLIAHGGYVYIMYRFIDQFFKVNAMGHLSSLDFEGINQIKGDRNFARTDRSGNIWMLTYSGALAYDSQLKPIDELSVILENKALSDMLEDREGNRWIATLKDGIFVMPDQQVFKIKSSQNPKFAGHGVQVISEDEEGRLLIGLTNGKVLVLNENQEVVFEYATPQTKEIESIYYDKENQELLVGCVWLYRFIKNKPLPIAKADGAAPKDIIRFNDDYVLYGNSYASILLKRNFNVPDPEDLFPTALIDFKLPANDLLKDLAAIIRRVRVRAVWKEGEDRIWVAHSDGLFYYDQSGEHEFLGADGKKVFGKCFVQTDDGSLWLGTLSQGLIQVKNTVEINRYTTENGRISNFCKTLVSDGKNIWIGTEKGVELFIVSERLFFRSGRFHGIMANEITHLFLQGPRLWIGTSKGLFYMPKYNFKINRVAPPVFITQTLINEQNYNWSDDLSLQHDQNNLLINFQGLAMRSRGQFQYKYRLLGLDTTWIYTNSANNFARYPSLPKGTYQFEVKAINEDSIESQQAAQLNFSVLPPYWATWWFRVVVSAFIFGLIGLLFYYRVRRIKQQTEVEKSLRSYQLAAIKAQMNPHFIFNVLNSIQRFIMLNDKVQANFYLGKFSDLIRMILTMSNKEKISLEEEIKALELYLELEALRFSNFSYTINCPSEIQAPVIHIPSMLIQPYVENALKHGLFHKESDRVLCIRFAILADQQVLFCEIEDNGVGRKRAEEIQKMRPGNHTSFATSANKRRLDLLNYSRSNAVGVTFIDLHSTQSVAQGTLVKIEIPFTDS